LTLCCSGRRPEPPSEAGIRGRVSLVHELDDLAAAIVAGMCWHHAHLSGNVDGWHSACVEQGLGDQDGETGEGEAGSLCYPSFRSFSKL